MGDDGLYPGRIPATMKQRQQLVGTRLSSFALQVERGPLLKRRAQMAPNCVVLQRRWTDRRSQHTTATTPLNATKTV